MADHYFEFTKIRAGMPYRVQREVLFRSMFPRDRDNSSEHCCKRTLEVLHLWRNRVALLSGSGWGVMKGPRTQWARNCPPHHIYREENRALRVCNQAKVCPWCWSRQHGSDTYQNL
jgi:hypothetical protein